MAIQDFIAHRIFRPSPSSQTQTSLRDSLIPVDGKAEELCRELKHTYIRKAGKLYGGFSGASGECPLPNWIREYLETKISFQKFVLLFVKHFQVHLDKTESALDNTLIAFREIIEAGDSIYLCLVDHTHGQYFDGELNLCDARYIDSQNINMALRIKTEEFLSDNGHNFLSVLKWRGEKELSDAFINSVGLVDRVDIANDTAEFLEVVSAYTQDTPDEIAKETKATIVEYCLQQDKTGKPIIIDELSKQILIDNKPDFSSFAKRVQPTGKSELIPDKTQLRNYIRISGRNEVMSMSFASAALGDSVVYDADTDSITIKNIPSALKSKLVKHLKQK